ncbi:hypothetical protein [Paenibacillus sp. 8b26]|uniref:hypothetical protein n=1 Tax=Paenibacillus sp. 8b26 TaxID=3424133 RepID=UPI003D65B225
MYKDIKDLIELLASGSTTVLAIIIAFVGFWIFKEVRTRYIRDMDFGVTRIDQILKAYGEIEYSIKKYLKNRANEDLQNTVLEKISLSYAYFSRELYKKAAKYMTDLKEEDLEVFLMELNKEVDELNYEQNKRIDIQKKELIIYYLNILKHFGIPIIVTVMTLLILLVSVMLVFALGDSQITVRSKVWLISICCAVSFYFLYLNILVDLWIEKRFKNSVVNWISVVAMILLVGISAFSPYLTVIYTVGLVYFMFAKLTKMVDRSIT